MHIKEFVEMATMMNTEVEFDTLYLKDSIKVIVPMLGSENSFSVNAVYNKYGWEPDYEPMHCIYLNEDNSMVKEYMRRCLADHKWLASIVAIHKYPVRKPVYGDVSPILYTVPTAKIEDNLGNYTYVPLSALTSMEEPYVRKSCVLQ